MVAGVESDMGSSVNKASWLKCTLTNRLLRYRCTRLLPKLDTHVWVVFFQHYAHRLNYWLTGFFAPGPFLEFRRRAAGGRRALGAARPEPPCGQSRPCGNDPWR